MPQTVQSVLGVYDKLQSQGTKNYFKSALSDSFEYPDELHNVLSHTIPFKQMTSTERIMSQSLKDASTNMSKSDIAKVDQFMTNPDVYKLSKQQNLLLKLTQNINQTKKPHLKITPAQKQVSNSAGQQTVQPREQNENSSTIFQHNQRKYRQQQEEEMEEQGIPPQEGQGVQDPESQQRQATQQIAEEQAQDEGNIQGNPAQPTDDQAQNEYEQMENPQVQQDPDQQVNQQSLTPRQEMENQQAEEQAPLEDEADQQMGDPTEEDEEYEQMEAQGDMGQGQPAQPTDSDAEAEMNEEDAQANAGAPSGFTPEGQREFAQFQGQPVGDQSQSQTSHQHKNSGYKKGHKKSLSKSQRKAKWIHHVKNEINQNKDVITQGLAIYSGASRQGKRYMRANLQLAHYHLDQFDDIHLGTQETDPKSMDQLHKSKQRLEDIANGIKRSQNDGHAMHVYTPLDDKEKQNIDSYLKQVPKNVYANNLIVRADRINKHEQQQKAQHQQDALKDTINRAKQDHTMKPAHDRLVDLYQHLSRPGRKFMRANMTLAGENYIGFQKAKRRFVNLFESKTQGAHADKKIPDKPENAFEKTLPWNMKRNFHGMNDALGGFAYTYGGKGMQVPRVHQDEALAIDQAMADPNNKAALASGNAMPDIKEIDKADNDRVVNRKLAMSAPKASKDDIDQMRQYYLNLKPRSRRYMANIARHAAMNYASMRRIVGVTPRDQLTQQERYESENLYQMSHGEKKVTDVYGHTYFRKVGTPLPPAERKDIRRLFLDPKCAAYWAKGSFNHAVNELNNGIHTHDKEIARQAPHETPVTTNQYKHDLLRGLKFNDKLEKAHTPNVSKYFSKSMLLMQKDPKTYNRIRYADPRDLSIHERNIKSKLNGVVDGKSPDITGKLIQTGTPATAQDLQEKQKVDAFLGEPRNQRMLKNKHGLNELIMQLRQKENIQHAQGRGDILKRMAHSGQGISSTLFGMASSTGSMMRNFSQQLQHPGVKHKFSQGRGHELYKRDIRRDLPGNDDPFER